MKEKLLLLLAILLTSCVLAGCGESNPDTTLTVLNYGKYINPKVLEIFEEETGIHIEYEEYISPENMYTKYKAGAIDYDVACTSDYMVEKLIQEDEVLEIDFSSFSNISNLASLYFDFSQSFDPENKYSIPYFFGTVGILYNKTMVDEVDMNSWSCLWDEKYKGQIVMANSVRDSFMAALKYQGYSLNTTDEKQLDEAQNLLTKQKPLVSSYLVDEAADEMIGENAALALVYSGEAAMAMGYNENLAFSVPKEGSNMWIDTWFIPATCRNKENAQKFLDFLCREDIARLNFDYVYYATPNTKVKEQLDAEVQNNETIFPPEETLNNCEIFKALDASSTADYNMRWKEIKSFD